eukprot:6238598-Prymnesium_polylepis.1
MQRLTWLFGLGAVGLIVVAQLVISTRQPSRIVAVTPTQSSDLFTSGLPATPARALDAMQPAAAV